MKIFRAMFLILLAGLSGTPAQAEQTGGRVALVVGVSAYRHVPALPNTLNDARALAAALTRIGFEVDTVTDPDRTALEGAVRRFGKRATGTDAALFFYAGHALEFGGRNWLVPIEADPRNERDIRFETLEVDAILEQIEGQARVSLVVLDSCRNNPFRQTLASGARGLDLGHGLAPQRAAVGTLVVYATAPGTEAADGRGPNSPFTTALLQHIEKPGVEIRGLLSAVRKDVREATGGRQVPWDSSALEGEFFLVATPAPPPPADQTVEVAFWNSVKDSTDATELRAYLSRYPDGAFAELARGRLARSPETKQETQPGPGADLEAAVRGVLSMVKEGERISQARRYVTASGGRALAEAPAANQSWFVGGVRDDAAAATQALEGCQMFADEACVLLARGDRVLPKTATGSWPPEPQSRSAYRGEFDPAMVPVRHPQDPTISAVSGYQRLSGPKALAIHPWGRTFTGTGPDQFTAEFVALKACNDDPDRKGANGPCFVYAAGNQVVLPDRRTTASAFSGPAATGGMERIEAIAGRINRGLANRIRNEYAASKQHKAFAVHLPTGDGYLWSGDSSAARSERSALEGCQLENNGPCILLAVDDEARTSDPAGATPQPMERVTYAGQFRSAVLPWNLDVRPAVMNYPGSPGGKAIAIGPHGARVAVVSGKQSNAEAERTALADCNKGGDGALPCFLYASGMQVVLAQRRTEVSR